MWFIKKIILTIFLLSIFSAAFAQDTLLNYFITSNNNYESILLKWEIRGGNTCNGIQIERSTDSINYVTIHSIAGICGNSSAPVPYSFIDENPVPNQKNYYRLKLGLAEPTSPVATFFASLNNSSHFLYPNPVNNYAQLYFRNLDQSLAKISIRNLNGQNLIVEQTNTDFITLNLNDLPTGLYIFSIEINGNIQIGRFVKN